MFWTIVLLIGAIYVINRFVRSLTVSNFSEKYVFITGCDTGFGRDLAVHLDLLGFHVIAGCLTDHGKDNLLLLCSSRVKACLLDVTSDESIADALIFARQILPRDKGVWAVVNNAGVGGIQAASEMLTKSDFVRTMNVNLLGPIEVTRQFLPLIRKERGRVVNITSVMGRFAGVNAPYCVSKFGFEGYLDVLRRELYAQGIKISMLEPGFFPTNMVIGYDRVMKESREKFENLSEDIKKVYGHDYCEKLNKAMVNLVSKLPSDNSMVVNAYTHAITARLPYTRYVVGWDAHFIFVPLTWLPDWFSDWLFFYWKSKTMEK